VKAGKDIQSTREKPHSAGYRKSTIRGEDRESRKLGNLNLPKLFGKRMHDGEMMRDVLSVAAVPAVPKMSILAIISVLLACFGR
jgi:predicted small secreted protein